MGADILRYRRTQHIHREQNPLRSGADARIIVQMEPDQSQQMEHLVDGLFQVSARLDPKYFYDLHGSALFSAICTLDEYYPTRTEARILAGRRKEIESCLPADAQWVDLGCGDCAKSRAWIGGHRDDRTGAGPLASVARFIGVDISQEWLVASLSAMSRSFAALPCVGVATDLTARFDLHDLLAEYPESPPVFFYPGSSLGNFAPDEALSFLTAIRLHLARHRNEHGANGQLLIGVDLVKDKRILEAAYDDALGVTAAFNRNALRVVNRIADADFSPRHFEHLAFFNSDQSRIEMHLRASQAQQVRIGSNTRHFAADETIRTEYSYKYTLQSFGELLREAGFTDQRCWTDERGWFGVWLAGL